MSTFRTIIWAIAFVAALAVACLWVSRARGAQVKSVTVQLADGSSETLYAATQPTPPASQPSTQPATMPTPTTLPANGVGLQPRSNTTYGLLNWIGGYQGILFSGNVSNVTIQGMKIVDPQYGIYQSMGLGGFADGCTFYDIDVSMPTRGEHGWRIYGARNQRAYRTKIVNYGVKFTGTTLAIKECDGMLFVDTYLEGLGPALDPLPLPSEKDYQVKNVQFVGFNAVLTSPLEIGGGCVNVSFAAHPGTRNTIRMTNLSKPVLNFPAGGHPLAIGTSFTDCDFVGGAKLFAGDPNGAKFITCTYQGQPIGNPGGNN